MQAIDLLVDKGDLRKTQLARRELAPLSDGEVLLAVDKFGFSSNNVTYALLGDALGYWRFFPAHENWGRIPVWGFAEVIESRRDGVQPGERHFGYFPMATHLVVQPVPTPTGFLDEREHRRALPGIYNRYTRVPPRTADVEAAEMLLRPLFFASFLVDAFLASNDFFDAGSVIIASASSKTAVGLAHLLARRRTHRVIGLTSPGNHAFVAQVGTYDRIVLYEAIDDLAVDGRAVLIDLAGNGEVRRAVHTRLGDRLTHSSIVGNTHAVRSGSDENSPGPQPQVFFGPAQLEKLNQKLGPQAVLAQLAAEWNEFLGSVGKWLRVAESRGPAAVATVYQSLLANRARPNEGHVLSLRE